MASVTASTGAPVVEISDYASPNEYWSNGYLSAYLLPNSAAGSITLTVNTPSAYTDSFISAVEFGNVPASPSDGQGTGTLHNYGADNDATTSTFSTSSASDMLWTMCEALPGITLSVDNAPITWTSVSNIAGNDAIILTEYGVRTYRFSFAFGWNERRCLSTALNHNRAGVGLHLLVCLLAGVFFPVVGFDFRDRAAIRMQMRFAFDNTGDFFGHNHIFFDDFHLVRYLFVAVCVESHGFSESNMTWGVGQRLSKCQIFCVEPAGASFLPFYSFSKPWLVNFSALLSASSCFGQRRKIAFRGFVRFTRLRSAVGERGKWSGGGESV